jgi:hypothetical protein
VYDAAAPCTSTATEPGERLETRGMVSVPALSTPPSAPRAFYSITASSAARATRAISSSSTISWLR